jgi:hypothetical protein
MMTRPWKWDLVQRSSRAAGRWLSAVLVPMAFALRG